MRSMSDRYAELSERLDERPRFSEDWKWLAALAVAGYCVTLGLRLLDVSNWAGPNLQVAGETIMATHDAYGWLAGAKGVNSYSGYGMAWLAGALSKLTGAPLWKIGFWGPAFLGSLTAVASGLWGWLLGGRRGALAAGFLGALSPGFYFRTRLGYYDSDAFTLLMPLLLGFFLAALLLPCCTRAWRPTVAERQGGDPLPAALPWLALGFGLVARIAHFAHDDIQPIGVMLFWLALFLVAVTGRPGRRVEALRLLLVYGIAAYAGPRRMGVSVLEPELSGLAGLAVAAGLAFVLHKRPARLAPVLGNVWVWAALLAALAVGCNLLAPLGPFTGKVVSYFKPMADAKAPSATGIGAVTPPSYPGITQSIREAKNVADLGVFFAGMSASPWLAAVAALGVAAIFVLRPAMLLMLPLVVMGMASLRLGIRFAMFAGPAFALGLGLGGHWLVKTLAGRMPSTGRLLLLAQALIVVGSLAGYAGIYRNFQATPVLAPPHGEALVRLKSIAPKDASLWTWWDYGYAAQYYAERMTPTDGGKHTGRDIFPTALALATGSYRQAAQMILLSAAQDNEPARRWDKLAAEDVRRELADLSSTDVPLKRAAPQYFLVCWENMNLLYWISFYGSWDVVAGNGVHAKTQSLNEPFNLDQARGMVVLRSGGAPIPVSSVDVLNTKGARRLNLPMHPGAPHLIINEVARQVLLLDDMAYGSMAVQLLIGDPSRAESSRYFKLVHEGFPLVRIYEVLPPAKEPTEQTEAFTQ